ncbi:MAG: hypothetical protein IPI52_00405 [Bacteroidetes bacterium]|nr:hypothetical protein [Bacteroidota bacterium]
MGYCYTVQQSNTYCEWIDRKYKDHQWHIRRYVVPVRRKLFFFNIIATQSACGAPTNLSSSNITTTSVNLSWTAGNGAISYNLNIKYK